MARSTARAAAMQLIYEKLMGGSGEDTLDALISFTPEGDDQAYIDRVVAGVADTDAFATVTVGQHPTGTRKVFSPLTCQNSPAAAGVAAAIVRGSTWPS